MYCILRTFTPLKSLWTCICCWLFILTEKKNKISALFSEHARFFTSAASMLAMNIVYANVEKKKKKQKRVCDMHDYVIWAIYRYSMYVFEFACSTPLLLNWVRKWIEGSLILSDLLWAKTIIDSEKNMQEIQLIFIEQVRFGANVFFCMRRTHIPRHSAKVSQFFFVHCFAVQTTLASTMLINNLPIFIYYFVTFAEIDIIFV